MNKYNQKLPKAVEKDLDTFIERVKAVQWFKPAPGLTKEKVETAVAATVSAFGVSATVEYRTLKTESDWDAAWGAARDAAWGAARDAARDAAWGAQDILATFSGTYTKDAPFLKIFALWEMGLYPCGVIDGKFVIYVPEGSAIFDEQLGNQDHPAEPTLPDTLVINGALYRKDV